MERVMKQSRKCTTFTYDVIDLTKEQMLEYVCDILNDDDITGHGLILTQPTEETDWPGFVKEIPFNPEGKEFAKEYKDIKITCITAVMEYHGQSMMISYQPEESIIPSSCRLSLRWISTRSKRTSSRMRSITIRSKAEKTETYENCRYFLYLQF